jgi:ABC-type antimicrobial peptide transport system permease subunit
MQTALKPSAAGIALGAFAALGVTRIITSLLFDVSGLDILTWGVGGIVIVTACVAASYLPARRAVRIDPIAALRAE